MTYFGDLGDRTNLFRSEFHVFVWHDIFESLHVLDQHILVLDRRRHDVVRSHIGQYARFDLDLFDQNLQVDFVPCADFRFAVNAVFRQQFFVLRTVEHRECFRNAADAFQSAFTGLVEPCLTVTVAFETDFFRCDNVFADYLQDSFILFDSFIDQCIDLFFELDQLFGDSRIDDRSAAPRKCATIPWRGIRTGCR